MKDIDEIQAAHESLMEKNALLMKQYEWLKQRDAELEADTTMSPVERLNAYLDLLDEFVRIASCACKETEKVKTLNAQLDNAVADTDDDGDKKS